MWQSQLKDFHDSIRQWMQTESPSKTDFFEFFNRPLKGDLAERFSIYGNGFGVRSRAVLEECFELLPKVLAERDWLELGRRFSESVVASHPNISFLAREFVKYLKTTEPSNTWILNLAEFELETIRSFHAFNAQSTIGVERVMEVSDESIFRFQPSTRLCFNNFRIATAWIERAVPKVPDEGKEFSVLCRTMGGAVLARVCDEWEWKVLKQLQEGECLGAAIDSLDTEISTEQLLGALEYWLRNNFFWDLTAKNSSIIY